MKRSKINAESRWAEALLEKNNIRLPETSRWSLDEWRRNADKIGTIRKVMMGWDITDFGSDDYEHVGAVLYTVRNGKVDEPGVGVPFCEKYILMREGQHLPEHYHVFKTEDIINRAGGLLSVYLWNASPDGRQLDTDVEVYMDGIKHVVKPGEEILITKGNSISLAPYIGHIFAPKPGTGGITVGQVSKGNDDTTDNYFLEPTARFADIEEDEPIDRPLCNEYDRI